VDPNRDALLNLTGEKILRTSIGLRKGRLRRCAAKPAYPSAKIIGLPCKTKSGRARAAAEEKLNNSKVVMLGAEKLLVFASYSCDR
jgi:hypothetical protein